MTITPVTLADLTDGTLEGSGVFDSLMRSNKAHLESEYSKGRIKGAEYATVYLGSLTQVMNTSLQFLLSKDKLTLESQLLEKQVLLAQAELDNAAAKLAQIQAQTQLIDQQRTNLVAEALNIPKQGLLIDANKNQVTQQTANLLSQKAQIETETSLTTQKIANAVIEADVLTATKCKLQAEFDLLQENLLKSAQETALLTWKVNTEKAQTIALGVDTDSVVGKQKILYGAQADGFARDAEQKAAKLLIDTWNTRRATDDATAANTDNKLNDVYIGQVVTKLLAGVGA